MEKNSGLMETAGGSGIVAQTRARRLSFKDRVKNMIFDPVYTTPMCRSEVAVLGPTDGAETIESSGIFNTELYPVEGALSIPSSATNKTDIVIPEINRDGTSEQIFKGLLKPGEELSSLCLDPSQSIQYINKYLVNPLTAGHTTLFLLIKGGELYVAVVQLHKDSTIVGWIAPFTHPRKWSGSRHNHVVIPAPAGMGYKN